MTKRAIISSFHSYSLNLLDLEPEAIISFDSHIDDYFGGSEKTAEILKTLPFCDRSVFQRASVHAILGVKRGLAGVPIHVVVPQDCFEVRSLADAKKLRALGVPMINFLEAKKKFAEVQGLRLFFCPPRNISYLFNKVRKYSTAVDLDVDYCIEFQDYCYTKAPKIQYEDGSISRVGTVLNFFRVVNRIRPNIVIVSEIKLSQILNPSGAFSQLLNFLKNRGYKIEFDGLVESDEIAEQALIKHEKFVKEVLPKESKELGLSASKTKEELMSDLKKADENQATLIKKYYT